MAIDVLKTVDIIELMENYVAKVQPPEHLRKQLDISYRIENQSVLLLEVRPDWQNNSVYHEYPYAKATYVKSSNIWKIYWLRANLKWYLYDPQPKVKDLKEFLDIVEEDSYGCFSG